MIQGFKYIIEHWSDVLALAGQHLLMSVGALLISLVVALPVGVLVARRPRLASVLLGVLGVVYTIPSLVLLVLFVPSLGLSTRNAVVVLVIYAQIMLLRNVIAAHQGIDPVLRDAARGMGLNAWERWWKVELPLALPVLLAGVRITLVALIGIATVAALIGAGGLGMLLSRGIALARPGLLWAGALAVSALAIMINSLLLYAEHHWTPLARVERALRGRKPRPLPADGT